MQRPKLIAGFFLRLIALYALLLLPWPGLEETYAQAFRWGGTKMLGHFGTHGKVWLVEGPESDLTHDTDLFVQNRTTKAGLGIGVSSRYLGYLPAAFLVSLIIATPLPFKRRARALLWGLIAIHALAVAQLAVVATFGFSLGQPPVMYQLGNFWGRTLAAFVQVIQVSPATWLVVPLFVWIPVTFRRGDVQVLLDGRGAAPPANAR